VRIASIERKSEKSGPFLAKAAGWIAEFRDNRSGQVAMLFGLMAIVLFLLVGGAVDLGRWVHARTQTIAAIDAAVLAGGRALQVNASDRDGALEAAQKYYAANVETRLALKSDSISFEVEDTANGTIVTATGSAAIETPFLKLANISELPLINESGAEFSEAKLAAGANAKQNFEISMMLDVTGSMCDNNRSPCTTGRKIDAMKTAAKDLVNIVVWDDQSEFTSRVAIVPFSTSVRLPASAIELARGKVDGSPESAGNPRLSIRKSSRGDTYYYNVTEYCVVERAGSSAYKDDAPGANNFVLPLRASVSRSKRRDYGSCPLTSAAELLPLSSDKTVLAEKIEGLKADGGTAGQVGTAWAWYTLSPNWGSLWAQSSRPVAYGTEATQKIAILMTDGDYNTQYTSDGIQTGEDGAGSTAANGSSVSQAKSLCDGMKGAGITVYTVGFEVGKSAKATLDYCATDPTKSFDAKNEEELKQAFRTIALEISQLYLSH
jgi:Flp pilus assembly protein TadG